jgi:hypothetical protein
MVSHERHTFLDRQHRPSSALVAALFVRLRGFARRVFSRMVAARTGRAEPTTSTRPNPYSARSTQPLAAAHAQDAFDVAVVDDDFGIETIRVRGYLGARRYDSVFSPLQATAGPKVLDLRAAAFSSDVFDDLAASWSAKPGHVSRLAIVLDFPHWAIFRHLAEPCVARLASIGVVAVVVYEERTRGMGLVSWFAEGPMPHNVAGVVESLCTRWKPAPIWPLVLAALSELLVAHADQEHAAALYAEAASLSLRCGGDEQAITFAREALRRSGDALSRIRCRSLRALADGLMNRGHATESAWVLAHAINVAAAMDDPVEGAITRCQAGLHALRRQDFGAAAQFFRDAIALVKPDQPELLATLHHNLSRALANLGSRNAASHAARALLLRRDKRSSAAVADRMLLDSIRGGRPLAN